jgi:hypothetical protein
MKAIADVLGVARSHLYERVHQPVAPRGPYCKAADEELLLAVSGDSIENLSRKNELYPCELEPENAAKALLERENLAIEYRYGEELPSGQEMNAEATLSLLPGVPNRTLDRPRLREILRCVPIGDRRG